MQPANLVIAINVATHKQNADTTMGTDVFVKIHITKMAALAQLVSN